MDDAELVGLRIPTAMRERTREIVAITDSACVACLDEEYAVLCRQLVARLARKRPRRWCAATPASRRPARLYLIGQQNFLFDRCQQPHLTSDQRAARLGGVKTTMANKAALISKTLNVGAFEPDLARSATLEQHALTWLVEVGGFIVDARMLPANLQDEARRRGLIPDLHGRRRPACPHSFATGRRRLHQC